MNIRTALPDDKFKILSLLNEVFEPQQYFAWKRDESYWKWKYDSNVFGTPIIQVVEHNNTIIASDTLWPWKFSCRGHILKVYQPCDTVVHKDYRGKDLFSRLVKSRIDKLKRENAPFAYNFPNNQSLKNNLNHGWHYLANITWLLRPLNMFGIISNAGRTDQTISVKIKEEHIADWDSCYSICDNRIFYYGFITTYHEKGFFEWRYKSHPFFDYGMATVEKGRNKACAIFSVNQKNKSRGMVVVDFLGDKSLSYVLFKKLIKIARIYNVDYLTTIYNPHFNMDSLWKQGFVKIRNKNMVVLPLDFSLENKMIKYSNWSIVGGMHDSL